MWYFSNLLGHPPLVLLVQVTTTCSRVPWLASWAEEGDLPREHPEEIRERAKASALEQRHYVPCSGIPAPKLWLLRHTHTHTLTAEVRVHVFGAVEESELHLAYFFVSTMLPFFVIPV